MRGVKPDGRAVEIETLPGKPRGKRLTNAQVRRIRDLLAVLLLKGVRLTPTDARRVLEAAPMGERNLRDRVAACPVELRGIVAAINQAAHREEPVDAA